MATSNDSHISLIYSYLYRRRKRIYSLYRTIVRYDRRQPMLQYIAKDRAIAHCLGYMHNVSDYCALSECVGRVMLSHAIICTVKPTQSHKAMEDDVESGPETRSCEL